MNLRIRVMNLCIREICQHVLSVHQTVPRITQSSFSLLTAMLLCAATGTFAQLPTSANEETNRVTISLVPKSSSLIQDNGVVWVALHMDILDGWHVYWRNPGDAGLPTEIRWEQHPGLEPGEIHWPAPTRFDEDGITTYGYSDEVWLPVPFRITDTSPPTGDNTMLSAQANWLVCKDICIPESARAELRFNNNGTFPDYSADTSALVKHTLEQLPRAARGWDATGILDGSVIRVVITPPEGIDLPHDPSTLYFYAYDSSILEHTAPQQVRLEGRNLVLVLPVSRYMPSNLSQLEGILVAGATPGAHSSLQALEFDIPISRHSHDR